MDKQSYKHKIETLYTPPKWCKYPYEPDPLGYCWSWALHQDGDARFKDARDGFCLGCEFNVDLNPNDGKIM